MEYSTCGQGMMLVLATLLLLCLSPPVAAVCSSYAHCYPCSLARACKWASETKKCIPTGFIVNGKPATLSLADCLASSNDGSALQHSADNLKRLLQAAPTPSPLSRPRYGHKPTWFTDTASKAFLNLDYPAAPPAAAPGAPGPPGPAMPNNGVTCSVHKHKLAHVPSTSNVVCEVEPANVNPNHGPPLPTLYVVAHWDTVPPHPVPVFFLDQIKRELAAQTPNPVPFDCSTQLSARQWRPLKPDDPSTPKPELVHGKPWFTDMLAHIQLNGNAQQNCDKVLAFLGIKLRNTQADYDLMQQYDGLDVEYNDVLLAEVDGADDNGSGMAVAIELLHMLAVSRDQIKYKVGIVFTAKEEYSFVGAKEFVTNLPVGLQTVGAIVMDQVGRFSSEPNSQAFPAALGAAMTGSALSTTVLNLYRANRLLLLENSAMPGSLALAAAVDTHAAKHGLQIVSGGTGVLDGVKTLHKETVQRDTAIERWKSQQQHPLLRGVAEGVHAASRAAVDVTKDMKDVARDVKGVIFMRSDHYPFWKRGLPAIQVTDTGNFRSQCYHAACDTTAPHSFRYAPWNSLEGFPGAPDGMGVDHTAKNPGVELDYTAMARLTRTLFDIATTAGLTPVTVQ